MESLGQLSNIFAQKRTDRSRPKSRHLKPSSLSIADSMKTEARMAARAYWQGEIRLALVSIPVEIYPASKTGAKISFNQNHEPSGKRIKYEKVVPGNHGCCCP